MNIFISIASKNKQDISELIENKIINYKINSEYDIFSTFYSQDKSLFLLSYTYYDEIHNINDENMNFYSDNEIAFIASDSIYDKFDFESPEEILQVSDTPDFKEIFESGFVKATADSLVYAVPEPDKKLFCAENDDFIIVSNCLELLTSFYEGEKVDIQDFTLSPDSQIPDFVNEVQNGNFICIEDGTLQIVDNASYPFAESVQEENIDGEQTVENDVFNSEQTFAIVLRKPEPLPLFARIKKEIMSLFQDNIFIKRFIGLFLLVSSLQIFTKYNSDEPIKSINNWEKYVESINIPLVLLFIVVGFVIMHLLCKKWSNIKFDSYLLVAGTIFFGLNLLWRNNNYNLCLAVIVVSAAVLFTFLKKEDFKEFTKLNKRSALIIIAGLALISTSFIAAYTVYQYLIFGNSCFDLGVFAQMYHSMITDFSLVTTCERDKFLSHFAVHFSPVFYLLAPVYYLFPHPQTLLIAQAVVVMSGVIPLYLICKKYNYSNPVTLGFSIVYLFSTALISPCFYDFHENMFLPPLLMWFFYAAEKKKYVLMYIMMALVLSVKEDAPLYLICIGLYFVLSNRRKLHGAIVAAFSAAYFVIVTSLMKKYGEGIMTSRTYGNLMTDTSAGFGNIIKTVVTNPGYFVSLLTKEDKLIFFITMLLPLAFMPLITKKASRFLIVVPFIVMNLTPDYYYASNMGYQYVFGTFVCLLYVTVLNFNDIPKRIRPALISFMAFASVFTAVSGSTWKMYTKESYEINKTKFETMVSYFQMIPDDTSVTADTWYVPHLANRKEIYMMRDTDNNFKYTDFVIVRLDANYDWTDSKIKFLEDNGYTLYAENSGVFKIYMSSDYRS